MTEAETSRRFVWAGYLLGFALGGFFDGILLHQILQWHHLLSALEGDVRFQVAADGYFHALMYVIAAAGLWMLSTGKNRSGRLLFAHLLIGFGVWHVVDSILSHWLLGIHRIRMDSENRLFWDLLWFGLFGLLPIAAGWLMKRGGGGAAEASRSDAVIRSLAALLVVGAGLQAWIGGQDTGLTTVLFAPGTEQARIFEAVASVEGDVVWQDPSGELVVLRMAEGQSGLRLFGRGAILVSGAGLPPGCFDYLRT